MSKEKEIINRILEDIDKEEKELANVVGYVLIKLFPTQKRLNFNKRHILSIIREYLKTKKK